MTTSLLAFLLAATLLTITPGVDTAMVLRTATVEGPRRAMFAAFGIAAGCLAWGAIVAAGLGTLLAASEMAYTFLRWVGATYLLYLGVKLIALPRTDFIASDDNRTNGDAFDWLRRGFLTNILNPKIGVFYVSFLPQFIPASASVSGTTLMLAAIHASLGPIWFAILIAATQPITRLLQSPSVVAWLDRIMGGTFIAFGIRLAFQHRN
jgi:threonine/homoserine/homoserine lactone efflux protein